MATDQLSGGDRRFLLTLGLPSLPLALAVTTVSALLPVLLQGLSGTALAGCLLALEGVFALFAPTLLGAWSDRLDTPIGPRLPFVCAAAPMMVVALLLLPLTTSVLAAGLVLVLFYAGYFAYFTPHFALYIDLVDDDKRGRSQGLMNLLREVGLAIGLAGGPALLAIGKVIPFAVAAAFVVAVTAYFVPALERRSDARRPEPERESSFRAQVERTLSILRREREVRLALLANVLWETALNAMRAFVVLYFTVGLGFSGAQTSLVLLIVALAALVVAPISGVLSDRYGDERILRVATIVYAAGVWVPAFFHSPWVLLVIPPVAASAVMVMTLPFSLLMSALPDDSEEREASGGGGSALFGISRGFGLLLGPLCGGLAIVACRDLLASSQGYGAVFLVAAVSIALSTLVLRRLDAAPGAKPAGATA